MRLECRDVRSEDINPTLPLGIDLLWAAMVLAWLSLTVVAWVSILSTHHSRKGSAFWWCLLTLAIPVFGPLVWFWARTRLARR